MTETTIAELADQVRAGIDADHEDAQWASNGPWWIEGDVPVRWGDERNPEVVGPKGRVAVLDHDANGALNADHIARHGPARVLAEVASKRALLDLALGWGHDVSLSGVFGEPSRPCRSLAGGTCDCGRDERVLAVLQHLAQPCQEKPC